MKTPGRVGEAAMYACGCWAADADLACNRSAPIAALGQHVTMHMTTMLQRYGSRG